MSLLSPTAFTFGADFIADYEYAGVGAGWGNYNEGEYSLRTSITMMFLDAALYGVLAWYLDKARRAKLYLFMFAATREGLRKGYHCLFQCAFAPGVVLSTRYGG